MNANIPDAALTPAMRQYLQIKHENSDSIIFFRMGDFYEIFFDDALLVSKALGLTLTARDREKKIPMCGVPFHAGLAYAARLVKDGHKVAICEQTTPAGGKGIVERVVTRVITPGTALEDEILSGDQKSNNYIAAITGGRKQFAFAYMDVSTGEFRITELSTTELLEDEIKRLQPRELVTDGTIAVGPDALSTVKKISAISKFDFELDTAAERLGRHFGAASLDGFGLGEMPEGVRAGGALLHYIKQTHKSELSHVTKCAPYFTADYLMLDSSTRRNLEITESLRPGAKDATLLDLLDRTKTSMGGRLLKSWLLYPLKDITAINARLDAIAELMLDRRSIYSIHLLLEGVYDLERLTSKVSAGIASPKDIIALKETLIKCPAIKDALKPFTASILKQIAGGIDCCAEAIDLIEKALAEPPPPSIRDGGVIKAGYNAALDELRDIGYGGKDWIARLEAGERKRTGINSLKVAYNRVFGYYIEITRANLLNVPQEYVRKQTLANAERFVTPALKDWEEKILSAEEKSKALESALFSTVLTALAGFSARMQATAQSLAALDAITSLTAVSHNFAYVRPIVDASSALVIEGGRHPVVEANLRGAGAMGFVSNSLALDSTLNQIIVLTGPNMAGKSTYLRQNALIVLMAQIGCFVPAEKAVIGAVDRIFTRVGASDDLSKGQSTFMVEMTETANILNNATPKSLVILDEIGRGTSTYDGLSIAWAVVEYLHDSAPVRARTLFATHYHELTDLALTKERVKNYNMAVTEKTGKVTFLRKVVHGGSSRSYGIQVARLAGLPSQVIERAKELLKNLESGELNEAGMPAITSRGAATNALESAKPLTAEDPLRKRLRAVDVNGLTPVQALMELNKLKELLGE
ncbi:DNA mismatch repair protein MutS [bacterium]|nr:MAG: DNA mismatch repair protein MutS [bacterium]